MNQCFFSFSKIIAPHALVITSERAVIAVPDFKRQELFIDWQTFPFAESSASQKCYINKRRNGVVFSVHFKLCNNPFQSNQPACLLFFFQKKRRKRREIESSSYLAARLTLKKTMSRIQPLLSYYIFLRERRNGSENDVQKKRKVTRKDKEGGIMIEFTGAEKWFQGNRLNVMNDDQLILFSAADYIISVFE